MLDYLIYYSFISSESRVSDYDICSGTDAQDAVDRLRRNNSLKENFCVDSVKEDTGYSWVDVSEPWK